MSMMTDIDHRYIRSAVYKKKKIFYLILYKRSNYRFSFHSNFLINSQLILSLSLIFIQATNAFSIFSIKELKRSLKNSRVCTNIEKN